MFDRRTRYGFLVVQRRSEVHRGALKTIRITAVVGDSGARAAWGAWGDAAAAHAPR